MGSWWEYSPVLDGWVGRWAVGVFLGGGGGLLFYLPTCLYDWVGGLRGVSLSFTYL